MAEYEASPQEEPLHRKVHYLTEEEAAEILRLKPQSLRQNRKLGKSPPYVKLFGKASPPLYPYAELLKWCEERIVRQGDGAAGVSGDGL
jgi:hypothetical protein